MLPDCYYYIGKIGGKRLLEKSEKFYSKYTKLIQIAMDLSNEVQHIQKLYNCLFKVSKSGKINELLQKRPPQRVPTCCFLLAI
jgi:hypothetical protein